MDGGIVSAVLANLAELVPVRTIYSYQRGILWCRGRPVKNLDPGRIVVWLPILMSVDIEDTVSQPMDTSTQTVTTADDQVVSVSMKITYEVVDMVRWYTVQDAEDSLEDVVQSCVTEVVHDRTWTEIRNPKTLCTAVRRKLAGRVKKWGIQVDSVGVVNLAPRTRTLRMFSD